MRIAVDIRRFIKCGEERRDQFTRETMLRIIAQHPEHEFIFFADHPEDTAFLHKDHIPAVTAGTAMEGPLSWYRWLEWQLPALLKKHQAAVFFSPGGFLSLRSHVNACMAAQDGAAVHFPGILPASQRRFLKRFAAGYAHKAAVIATVSEFAKKEILSAYDIVPEKVTVVYPAATGLFRRLAWEEREQVKKEFADGKEYFVCTGNIHPRENILQLLKAFSLLKMRLYPNMQLLLAGKKEKGSDQLVASLDTYRFRHDVKIITPPGEALRARLLGGAYALVCPAAWDDFNVHIAEALACGVPAVVSRVPGMEEAGGAAALYFDPGSVEDMGDKLCLLYKDEPLRSRLIGEAPAQSAKFSWDKAAEKLWECIETAAYADKKY